MPDDRLALYLALYRERFGVTPADPIEYAPRMEVQR